MLPTLSCLSNRSLPSSSLLAMFRPVQFELSVQLDYPHRYLLNQSSLGPAIPMLLLWKPRVESPKRWPALGLFLLDTRFGRPKATLTLTRTEEKQGNQTTRSHNGNGGEPLR